MLKIGRTILGIATAVALVMAAGCGGGQDQDGNSGTANAGEIAKTKAASTFAIGQPAPDFQLKNLAGETVTLSEHRGKAVIVDFWATWCGPCRMAMPHLQDLSEEYAGKLEVLAISLDQNPAKAVPPFVKKMGLTFTVLADVGAAQVARDYGNIRSIPTTFLVGPDGVLLKQWVGMSTKAAYEAELKKIL